MTQSISRESRTRVLQEPIAETTERRRDWQVIGVRIFTGLAVLAGVGLTVADLASSGRTHLIIPAATCFIVAAIGAAVLVLLAQIADRQEFYRRGQLEGWYRGYRMLLPEVDDPLLRRRPGAPDGLDGF